MATNDEVLERLRTEIDFPEGWNAFKSHPFNYELSGFDGSEMQEALIEVINDDRMTELVLFHAKMPGGMSAHKIDEIDEPVTEIPHQIGVLKFDSLDEAIVAANELADPDILGEIARLRSPIEMDQVLPVIDAVERASELNLDIVIGTAPNI